MADNFFGFDTAELGVLGRPDLDEELLTDDVEEEYDALNDETFGQAANDDWEEAHEKLSELIKNNNIETKSYFNDSLLENDDSQEEIVSKSISQLGLEDDLDDPAIMTVSRNCHSASQLRSVFGPSPPPAAFLETEVCGSPKTHSIWSTTPKDSGISLLQSLSRSSSSLSHQDHHHIALNSPSDNVFISPQKAWRAEELERDLLSSSSHDKSIPSGSSWPQPAGISLLAPASNQNLSNKSHSQRFPNLNHNQNKINQRVFTREEVERQMLSDPRLAYQHKGGNFAPVHLPPSMMHPNVMPPVGTASGNNLNTSLQSPRIVPLRPRAPMMVLELYSPSTIALAKSLAEAVETEYPLQQLDYFAKAIEGGIERPFVPFTNNIHPRNILRPQIPPNDYLVPTHAMKGLIGPYYGLAGRTINHPMMPNWKPINDVRYMYDKHYEGENYRNGSQNVEDEYAGLMTQREKEWLIRIQMLLLKSENPYVEDYYYATQIARKFKKKYSENAKKGSGDAPELILPETPKPENKTYVPTQFEGSLGKLQAVSVNFPRKVLDIKVARPLEDDEGRVVTNQSLMKYRRLLLDIEKLYTWFLEIDDEEKRILAKPDTGEAPHRKNIASLTLKIYNGLCSENLPDEHFQNIMLIRKGRNLVMRALPLFNMEQKLQCLISMCRCLSVILKKDQNDLVLVKNFETVTDVVLNLMLPDLVQIAEVLESGSMSESSKEKNNYVAALKNKFGSSVICAMINRAENLYSGYELFENAIQARWAKAMLHVVDILCNMENTSLSPPLSPAFGLLNHFQRFAVDRDKFEILKQKLKVLETDSINGEAKKV